MALYFFKPVVWNDQGYQRPGGAKFRSGYPAEHEFSLAGTRSGHAMQRFYRSLGKRRTYQSAYCVRLDSPDQGREASSAANRKPPDISMSAATRIPSSKGGGIRLALVCLLNR